MNRLMLATMFLAVMTVACVGPKTQNKEKAIGITQEQKVLPLLRNKAYNEALHIIVNNDEPKVISEFNLELNGDIAVIEKLQVFYAQEDSKKAPKELFGEVSSVGKLVSIAENRQLNKGENHFFVSLQLKENADVTKTVSVGCNSINQGDQVTKVSNAQAIKPLRLGIGLRQHGDDNVDTYRIPGLATTNNGTLIGVYDIRYNSGVDLQEDIDVGMNRSTDGGQTWEPMKIIMDMGEWGSLSDKENGIGDPAVLVDRSNNTIWVAAVWAHGHPGERNWWASKPGLSPKKTSQFVLVKSEDDGVTWSEPINITEQIKKPEWHLLLQGPGKGITMKDGTLVFPAQFKDKDEMPHSTIIWSKDNGQTWTIGTGAKDNTTEAQVIELNDGSLMLNMRDNRNRKDDSETNGRAVYITHDLGKTWVKHATSRTNVLQESTCQASIIKDEFVVNGKKQALVIFSNPNTKKGRHHMTIKVSLDDGETWPLENQLLLDAGKGRGYSCMSKIDDETIGILYEGSQADLTYQIVKIKDIIK